MENWKPHFSMAGVLVFSMCSGRPLFLIGKEVGSSEFPHSINKWSAFSGVVEKNETPIEAAVREFCEESLCTVQYESCHPNQDFSTYKSCLYKLLKNKQYFCKLIIPFSFMENQVEIKGLRTLFVIKVPFQEDIRHEFNYRLSSFDKIRRLSNLKTCPSMLYQRFCEKNEIKWVSCQQIALSFQKCNSSTTRKAMRFKTSFLNCIKKLLLPPPQV